MGIKQQATYIFYYYIKVCQSSHALENPIGGGGGGSSHPPRRFEKSAMYFYGGTQIWLGPFKTHMVRAPTSTKNVYQKSCAHFSSWIFEWSVSKQHIHFLQVEDVFHIYNFHIFSIG